MSTADFQGFVHSLKVFMRLAQDEIDRGEKSGARVTGMNKALMFSKASDEWSTPQAFYDELNAEFQFQIDLAASAENTKCEVFYGQRIDALSHECDWSMEAEHVRCGWLNPPYSKCRAFIEKAARQARRGFTTVALVPSRTDTRWWHEHVWNRATNAARPGVEIRFIKGRLRFGGAAAGAPFPSVVIIFDGRRTGREGTAG